MRAVIQRVKHASVSVEEKIIGKIEKGLLILLSVSNTDEDKDLEYIFDKTIGLRIFEDEAGKLNKSVQEIEGSLLVVSQFTLHGDARKGKRPSFSDAARPEKAIPYYEEFIRRCKEKGITTEQGIFGADMQVELCNDGPVTILLDSSRLF